MNLRQLKCLAGIRHFNANGQGCGSGSLSRFLRIPRSTVRRIVNGQIHGIYTYVGLVERGLVLSTKGQVNILCLTEAGLAAIQDISLSTHDGKFFELGKIDAGFRLRV